MSDLDERGAHPSGPIRRCRPRATLRRGRAAVTAVLTVALTAGCAGPARPLGRDGSRGSGGPGTMTDRSGTGRPPAMLLRAYEDCGALPHGLRTGFAFRYQQRQPPRRIDRITRAHTPSETPIDPHAFLYWPRTGTAVIPIDSWDADESGAALVLHVAPGGLQMVGTIRNPGGAADTAGIERTLVIGSSIWTMSPSGWRSAT